TIRKNPQTDKSHALSDPTALVFVTCESNRQNERIRTGTYIEGARNGSLFKEIQQRNPPHKGRIAFVSPIFCH
ncbi:MAG: hypothetical protein Q9184_007509, partial [Pyrenodesmia sp. 2 TL-2023]